MSASSARVAMPREDACSASAEAVTRSAHKSAHHARSWSVLNTHAEPLTVKLPEASLLGPAREAPAGVRIRAVALGDANVHAQPGVEPRVVGKPSERAVVAVAHGDDACRRADAAHLAQRAHWLGQVLQDLMGMHDIEGRIIKRELVYVARDHAHRGLALRQRLTRFGEHGFGAIQSHDRAVRNVTREVERQRARAAADVEQALACAQVRAQIRSRVVDGSPAMRAQNAVVMAVCVDLWVRHAPR